MQVNKLIPKIKITQSATLLTVDQAPWHTYDLTNTFHSHHFFPSTSFHTFLIRTNSNNSVLSVKVAFSITFSNPGRRCLALPPPKKEGALSHLAQENTNNKRQEAEGAALCIRTATNPSPLYLKWAS